jgi:hypothetical protein
VFRVCSDRSDSVPSNRLSSDWLIITSTEVPILPTLIQYSLIHAPTPYSSSNILILSFHLIFFSFLEHFTSIFCTCFLFRRSRYTVHLHRISSSVHSTIYRAPRHTVFYIFLFVMSPTPSYSVSQYCFLLR